MMLTNIWGRKAFSCTKRNKSFTKRYNAINKPFFLTSLRHFRVNATMCRCIARTVKPRPSSGAPRNSFGTTCPSRDKCQGLALAIRFISPVSHCQILSLIPSVEMEAFQRSNQSFAGSWRSMQLLHYTPMKRVFLFFFLSSNTFFFTGLGFTKKSNKGIYNSQKVILFMRFWKGF